MDKRSLIMALMLWLLPLLSYAKVQTLDVGVLATRGAQEAKQRWQPTMDWLTSNIANTQFLLHPFTLNEMEQAVKDQQVDFVITNPGQAVLLGRQYPLSWLATLNSAIAGGSTHTIGSTVVVRADSSFKTLNSLNGTAIAGVAENAFGGYLTFRFEIDKLGLDQSSYFSDVRFLGFPLDALLYQLRDNQVEAAVVPVCILENMASEGLITLSDYRVINNMAPQNFDCKVSTSLYPNWSFAKTDRVSNKLAKLIAKTLFSLPSTHRAALAANSLGWTSPISQLSVDKLYQGLDMHPLQKPWWQEAFSWLKSNQQWGWAFFLFFVILNGYHFLLEFRFSRSKRALEQTLYELKEKNSMLEHSQRVAIVGELGSSLAHEINQPLAAIRNYSQGGMLQIDKGKSAQQLAPVFEKIQQQVIRADSIIQRLRNLINKRVVEKSYCEVDEVLSDTLELLAYSFNKQNITIHRVKSPSSTTLFVDRVGLQQVLLNVLNNAVEACQTRSIQYPADFNLQIIVSVEVKDGSVFIKVSDNGIGLQQEASKLSAAFFTTKEQGLGLGLAICQGVIEAHHGQLQLQAIKPNGCCVTITLPQITNKES